MSLKREILRRDFIKKTAVATGFTLAPALSYGFNLPESSATVNSVPVPTARKVSRPLHLLPIPIGINRMPIWLPLKFFSAIPWMMD